MPPHISVTITSPANSATITGTTLVAWSKTGPTKGFQLSVDGVVANPWQSGMSAPWDSRGVPDGPHTLTVTARDGAGKTVASTVTVTASNVTVPAVNCVVSPWSAWAPLPDGIYEQRTRTITTPASGGGTPCPPPDQLVETRLIASPPAGGLIYGASLTYQGAFRAPLGLDLERTYEYGGTGLCYWPARDSLLMVGHDWYQQVGEISIPTPVKGATLEDLPRATFQQPLTDILQGKRNNVDGAVSNGIKIGGLVVTDDKVIVNVWAYYDGGPQFQTLSHFVVGRQDFALLTPNDVDGPFQVGTGYGPYSIAGFVSGYMCPIPAAYQALLGGTHLAGQGGYVSVISRTSSGPSANAFNVADLGRLAPAPANKLMGYPIDHPTLGQYGVGGGLGLFNGTQGFRGMVWPEGTRSILFVGWGGSRFCYGAATADQSLDYQPLPPPYEDVHYCYDPAGLGGKGTTGYPYQSLVFAYDVNDFIAVQSGLKLPWEIAPYATWPLTVPYSNVMVDQGFGMVDTSSHWLSGAAYDPIGRRLFVAAYKSDGPAPIVHVFTVS